MADNRPRTLILQSTSEEVQHLKPFIEELQKWVSFDDEMFSVIRLALNEAVMNAINHGNKNDSAKRVYIRAEKQNEHLAIHVKDEGNGFDVTDIPDPTDEDNLWKPSGRGVFLIRQQADEVYFSKEEATITMIFKF